VVQVLGKRENDGGVAMQGVVGTRAKPLPIYDADINWADIKWIKRCHPQVKVFLKGVGSVEDAVRAKDEGVDGIVLSNHGVRFGRCVSRLAEIVGRAGN
jgi:isopentenyl diphosphate isomerase/L-lactate dehydrogenase-like FMN-dependent dehydrogenase